MSTAVQDPFLVGLERFQGPLDLLLHLIRKQDIDIFDIPIARITEQFLAATLHVDRLELDRAGEFLEMAATLVRIKAQMLFPRRVEEEEDDPRADLVRRLLEHEHFLEAAHLLVGAERDRARYYPKGYVEVRAVPPASEAPLETSWEDVRGAVRAMAERLEEPEPGYRITGRMVRVDEKIDLVVAALQERASIEFSALVMPWGTRLHAVISLLACLELAKQSTLTLRQASPFAPLWVYRRGAG
ncbi:MAG TPA: segregation/condensation protein A [Longimicrobiaceae bacterium]|nr:segregation/condensation protein A [Longimicrobiaceae bacterium]